MTPKERAYDLWERYQQPIPMPLGMPVEIERAIEDAVKEATEDIYKAINHHEKFWNLELERVCQEKVAILAIARELAAKCQRGQNACMACGACGYMGKVTHNDGCLVVKLEKFQ